jgi:hypothetical protein
MFSGAGKNRGAHRTPFQPARSRVTWGGPFAPRCRHCLDREETIDALAMTVGALLLVCAGLAIALVVVAS